LPSLLKKLNQNRYVIIPNGYDDNRMDKIRKEKSNFGEEHIFSIVTVGRMINIKNPFLILRIYQLCVKKMKNTKLIFIGDGPLKEDLKKEINGLGLTDNVIFTGKIKREEVYRYLLNASIYISCSEIEGLPVSVLEAMACECPVILSNIAPHREIEYGSDGCVKVVKNNLAEEYFNIINRLYNLSKKEQKYIGEKCHNYVELNYSLKKMNKNYNEIFKSIAYNN